MRWTRGRHGGWGIERDNELVIMLVLSCRKDGDLMTVQTLWSGKNKFVVIREKDYLALKSKVESKLAKHKAKGKRRKAG